MPACIARGEPHGYTLQHLALLSRLAPLLAKGLRTALLLENARRGDGAEQDDPGLVVLADDLSIAATTPAGERWLVEISDRTSLSRSLKRFTRSSPVSG